MNKFLLVFLSLCIFGQHVHSTTKLLSSSVKDLNGDLHPKHRHLSEEGTLNLRIDGRGYFQYRLPITLTDASNDPSQKRRLASCNNHDECPDGYCEAGECLTPKEDGQGCFETHNGADCQSGYCSETGNQCETPTCPDWQHTSCPSGFFCNNKVCNRKIDSGNDCWQGNPAACKSGYCAYGNVNPNDFSSDNGFGAGNGICLGDASPGDIACSVDLDCVDLQYKSDMHFRCALPEDGSSTGTCVLKTQPGGDCVANEECESYWCNNNNKCSELHEGLNYKKYNSEECNRQENEPWDTNIECKSGRCHGTTCQPCDGDDACNVDPTNPTRRCNNPNDSGTCTPLLYNGERCEVYSDGTTGGEDSYCRSGICIVTELQYFTVAYCHDTNTAAPAAAPACINQDESCYGAQDNCCAGLECQGVTGPDTGTCKVPAGAGAGAPAADATCDTDCSSCTTDSTCIASQDSCNWKATGSGSTDGSCAPSYDEAYADSPPPANAAGIGGLPDKGDGTNSVENTDDGDGDAKTISEVVYSRDGSMHVNKFGYLVDDNGFLLVSESRNTNDANAKFHIHIPSRADDIVVTPTGKILAMELGGGQITKVGQLKVVRFENAQGLNIRLQMKSYCVAAGESGFNLGNWCEGGDLDGKNHTYMSETEVSGPGIVGNPGDQGFGRILKSK